MIVLEEIRETERFGRLQPEWDELLRLSRSRCVFLTHEWLFTWLKHLAEDRQLALLTARESGRLVGVFPLTLRKPAPLRMTPEMLEFIGSGVIGSDYLDLILHPRTEAQVLASFAEWLDRTGRIVQLSQLRRGSSAAQVLARRLTMRAWRFTEAKINVCPFVELQGHTWETYLADLSANQRYNFHRRVKKLTAKPGFCLRQAATPEEGEEFLEIIMRLHRERWSTRGGESEAFQNDAICAFHREFIQLAFRRGWLRLLTMWVDGRPIAGLYGLRYEGSFSFYQSGFDPEWAKESAGLVMMGLAIRAAIEEGCAEYDLLHGDEEYKFHWTRRTRDLARLELFPAHARARVYKHAMRFNRVARRMAHRVLQKL